MSGAGQRSQNTDAVQASYDRAATEYASHLYGELVGKPLDRELLDRFADRIQGKGVVCDLGCGPGQIARYLHDRGVEVCGIDLSRAMVERASKLNPGIAFAQGDILSLDVDDDTWTGIAAFYAIVNFPSDDLIRALSEMRRVLKPSGWLLLSFHIGDEVKHVDDLWGNAVSLDFFFFRTEVVTANLRTAGFEVAEVIEREPYGPEIEYPSRRAYIFARKPTVKTS